MKNKDYIISIEEMVEPASFFAELLEFFAKHDVILTTWGKIPPTTLKSLSEFKAPCNFIRRKAFKQSEFHLNEASLGVIKQALSDKEMLNDLTWGIIKSDTPLGLSHSWDDIIFNGSNFVDDAELTKWIVKLKTKGIIHYHEEISDNQRVEPTRITPVDEVQSDSRAAHP